jgi:hypothetical protein
MDPVQWEIEGSNDGKDWKTIDSRRMYQTERNGEETWPNGFYGCRDSKPEQASNDFFRFILLRQTGKNVKGSDSLELRSIEFFGRLKE